MQIQRKTFIVLIVLMMLLVTVIPAFAAKGGQRKFNVAGTITSVDSLAGTVTVHIVLANRIAKGFIGQDMTMQTAPETLFYMKTPDGRVPITLAELVVGENVRVKGSYLNSVWGAKRVVMGVPLPANP